MTSLCVMLSIRLQAIKNKQIALVKGVMDGKNNPRGHAAAGEIWGRPATADAPRAAHTESVGCWAQVVEGVWDVS